MPAAVPGQRQQSVSFGCSLLQADDDSDEGDGDYNPGGGSVRRGGGADKGVDKGTPAPRRQLAL